MHISTHVIPQDSIDTLAKGVYNEAIQYGFKQKDILRLVNTLLQLSMTPPHSPKEESLTCPISTNPATVSKGLKITQNTE